MAAGDAEREAAIKRLKDKRAFGTNVVSFVAVNVFLIVIWAITGQGFFWPAFVIFGWGIGLAGHAWRVYGQKPITEADIEREMRRGRQPDEGSSGT